MSVSLSYWLCFPCGLLVIILPMLPGLPFSLSVVPKFLESKDCVLHFLRASHITSHGLDMIIKQTYQQGKIAVVMELVTQPWLTLSDSVDWNLPGSPARGVLQARVLMWVGTLFSREFSWPRDWTQVSFIAGRFLTIWATREAQQGKRIHNFLYIQKHGLYYHSFYLYSFHKI